MPRWLLCLTMLVVPACAASQKTAMIECPAAGCSTATSDPIGAQLEQRASADLACAPNAIVFTDIGPHPLLQQGPWEARGCGKQAIYRNADGAIGRISLVAKE
jgi:hypothetical protein